MTRYVFQDFTLDTERMEIAGPDGQLEFEPQVFDVLRFLIEAEGRLVTKEQLLDNVWGDRFISESAMTTRIKQARRLIGDDGRTQWAIRTVHGRGYRFMAEVHTEHEFVDAAPGSIDPAPRPIPSVRIGVLGPLTISGHDGATIEVTSPAQRRVLAALVAHRRAPVALEQLAGSLETSSAGLRTAISRLRDALGAATITTEASGYILAGCTVDADDFEAKLRDVRSAEPHQALVLLDQAIGLHRAPTYTEFAETEWARPEAAHLDELHSGAVEDRGEALIAVGRYTEAAAAMEAHTASHPLRDRPRGLLMRALAAQGRQAEALRAYQDHREYLGEEIGTEPGAELVELEARIATGWRDTEVAPAPATPAPDGLRRRRRPAGNLPALLTSFVGREDELKEIASLLEANRLVTLTGLGGIGKTTTALQSANELAGDSADGYWLIDLVPVDASTPLPDTFLNALAPNHDAGTEPIDLLLEHLAPLEVLLLVDNCENRLTDAADVIAQILRHCAGVRVLATSRTPLGVPGEAVVRLAPLAEATAAVELFTNRARLIRPDFDLDDSNRAAVEQICTRLDGIPLAVELAAARLNVANLEQIVDHLDDRFALLTATGRGDRLQALEAALAWSVELLDDQSRAVLRRLSVFAGSFGLPAAHTIAAPELDSIRLLDVLGNLVETNLLIVDAREPEPRYRLLETVREYAFADLADDEAADAQVAHASYYAELAQDLRVQEAGDHRTAIGRGEADLANFRSAMAWCFESDQHRLGTEIARQLRMYFWSRRLLREGARWLHTGLIGLDDEADETLLAYADLLVFATNIADSETAAWARTRIEAALDGDRTPAVRSRLLSSVAGNDFETDPAGAGEMLAEATELAIAADSPELLSCLNNRAENSWLAGYLHDEPGMRAALETLSDQDRQHPIYTKIQMALASRTGDWEAVIELAKGERQQSEMLAATSLGFVAEALGALGRTDEAVAFLDQLLDFGSEEGPHVSFTLKQMVGASVELQRGNTEVATTLLQNTAAVRMDTHPTSASRVAVIALAGVAAEQLGKPDDAAFFFGYSAEVAQDLRITLRPSDQPLVDAAAETARSALGDDAYETLTVQGAAATWDEVFARLESLPS